MQLTQEILMTFCDFFLYLLQQDFVTITKMKMKKQINH